VRRNLIGLLLLSCLLILSLVLFLGPAYAERLYGPPDYRLGMLDRWNIQSDYLARRDLNHPEIGWVSVDPFTSNQENP
jgi:hypothetical protein